MFVQSRGGDVFKWGQCAGEAYPPPPSPPVRCWRLHPDPTPCTNEAYPPIYCCTCEAYPKKNDSSKLICSAPSWNIPLLLHLYIPCANEAHPEEVHIFGAPMKAINLPGAPVKPPVPVRQWSPPGPFPCANEAYLVLYSPIKPSLLTPQADEVYPILLMRECTLPPLHQWSPSGFKPLFNPKLRGSMSWQSALLRHSMLRNIEEPPSSLIVMRLICPYEGV